MITGELRSKVDRIWDTMWSGGISNPYSCTVLIVIKAGGVGVGLQLSAHVNVWA